MTVKGDDSVTAKLLMAGKESGGKLQSAIVL
jgi:hypothetical protein